MQNKQTENETIFELEWHHPILKLTYALTFEAFLLSALSAPRFSNTSRLL